MHRLGITNEQNKNTFQMTLFGELIINLTNLSFVLFWFVFFLFMTFGICLKMQSLAILNAPRDISRLFQIYIHVEICWHSTQDIR